MFGRRKKFTKKVSHDEGALSKFAVTVNGLKLYADQNETVRLALERLQKNFSYTPANAKKTSAKILKEIAGALEKLKGTLEKENWDENDILHQIKLIDAKISFYASEGATS